MGKKVLIIGAVALGPKVACRLRRLDPDAEITMIDRDDIISYGGCGIPYFVSGDVQNMDELLSTVFHVKRDEKFFDIYKHVNVRTKVEALKIDRRSKTVLVRDINTGKEEELPYDTLVLGTGSSPFIPPIEGTDLPGVTACANMHQAAQIKDSLTKLESAVIVGGGAIGIEMAEALTDMWGIETTLVEMQDSLLPQALGREMSTAVKNELEKNGVRVLTGECVTKVLGDEDGVTGVMTSESGEIDCDMVIFAVGARPNSQLASEAGLATGRFGGILVDERMQTSDPNIYAGGDCCEVRHLVSGNSVHMPLGSMANRQGRVIGTNAAGGNDRFPGVVGTFCLKAFEMGVATAGLTEKQAEMAGYEPASAMVSGADRAHFYPTQALMFMKLIADRKTRKVLGVEAIGPNGDAVKARVDAVAAAIQFGATVDQISNLEVGYAPPYASAMDIVNAVANVLANILDGFNDAMPMDEFIEAFRAGQCKVLDVRSESNAAPYVKKYGADRWVNIPQDAIPQRLDEIPQNGQLVCFCNTGLRSYEIHRYLQTKGVKNLKNAQGGHGFLRAIDPSFTE